MYVPRYLSLQPGAVDGKSWKSNTEYAVNVPPPYEIRESEVLAHIQGWREARVVREVGDRNRVSWVHAVIHRSLFDVAGCYRDFPPHPESNDLHLNSALRGLGVTSVGIHNVCLVNARVFIGMDV